jgi:hypothetical protein
MSQARGRLSAMLPLGAEPLFTAILTIFLFVVLCAAS